MEGGQAETKDGSLRDLKLRGNQTWTETRASGKQENRSRREFNEESLGTDAERGE